MSDDDESIRLMYETDLPEKMKEAEDAARKLKAEEQALAAVTEQLAKANEELVGATDLVGKSARASAMQDVETAQAVREVAQAEEEKAVKIDAATQKVYDQIRAEQNMRDMLETVEPAVGKVVGPDEEKGFKGLATNAQRAEKAINSLMSGNALGRLGGLLEPITAAMGGPAGLGVAIGAVVYGVETLLPKLNEMFKLFQEGPKWIRDLQQAMDRYDEAMERSASSAAKKRALGGIDQQIAILEDWQLKRKHETGMELPPEDEEKLKELRRRSREGHKEAQIETVLGSIGPSSMQRELGSEVRTRFEEAGGVEGVFGVPAGKLDDLSRQTITNAIKGNKTAATLLANWFPDIFSGMKGAHTPESERRATEETKNWDYIQAVSDAAENKDKIVAQTREQAVANTRQLAAEKARKNKELFEQGQHLETTWRHEMAESDKREKTKAEHEARKAAQTALKTAREAEPEHMARAAQQAQEADLRRLMSQAEGPGGIAQGLSFAQENAAISEAQSRLPRDAGMDQMVNTLTRAIMKERMKFDAQVGHAADEIDRRFGGDNPTLFPRGTR